MIVGRNKEIVINYVDCLAGPWKDDSHNLSNTSIGVSLEEMASCQESLRDQNRHVSFRALYIEKNPVAFRKLDSFLSQQPYPNIEADCWPGDYTELLGDIVNWCGDYFTFFFIDPQGWKNFVNAETLLPLLKLAKAEFLINLMYDFINRVVTVEKHAEDMTELFGEIPAFDQESSEQRQAILLSLYREKMKDHYLGRAAHVPVNKPGADRVLYYLVYLTRSAVGINTFKSEAEKMEIVQRITQQECKLRRKIESSGSGDLFGGEIETHLQQKDYPDNRYMAKRYLLDQLSECPLLIDNEKWADFLEDSDLYPRDFQVAMKELVKDGLAKNIDADVSRRRTQVIKPSWPRKSERWVLTEAI